MMLARPRTELVVPMPSPRHRRVSARACSPLPALVTAGPIPGEFQLSLDDLEEGRVTPKNYIEVSLVIFTKLNPAKEGLVA